MLSEDSFPRRLGLIFLLSLGYAGLTGGDNFWISLLITCIYTFCFWEGNHIITTFIFKRFPRQEELKARLITQISASVIYTLLTAIVVSYLLFITTHWVPFTIPYIKFIIFVGLAITFAVSGIYQSIFFFRQWRATILEKEKLHVENLENQLNSLKNQVNPHFLFNSLNVLATLIHTDTEKAETFIKEFSAMYRYILEKGEKNFVTLQEELEFLKAFIFLQKIRFGDNIKVHLQIDSDELQKLLPPVALQSVVENAFKHNIVSKRKPLQVSVSTKEGAIWVKNNLQKREDEVVSTGLGLQNLKAKYALLSDKKPEFYVENDSFTARLPLLEVEI